MGNYLFGSAWQPSIAAIFGVPEATLTDWMDGTQPIREGIWRGIILMVAATQLPHVLNAIAHMQETYGVLPEVTTLFVSDSDHKHHSPHHRLWTAATDALIKTHVAATLIERGVKA